MQVLASSLEKHFLDAKALRSQPRTGFSQHRTDLTGISTTKGPQTSTLLPRANGADIASLRRNHPQNPMTGRPGPNPQSGLSLGSSLEWHRVEPRTGSRNPSYREKHFRHKHGKPLRETTPRLRIPRHSTSVRAFGLQVCRAIRRVLTALQIGSRVNVDCDLGRFWI